MPTIAEHRRILMDADGRQVVIAKQSTLQMTMTLVDEAGVPMALDSIATATLTIYARDEPTQPVINSVDHVDIKNTGRGAIHATSGLLTLTLDPLDNIVQNSANDLEWHRFLIEVVYSSTKKLKYEIEAPVRNLSKVT